MSKKKKEKENKKSNTGFKVGLAIFILLVLCLIVIKGWVENFIIIAIYVGIIVGIYKIVVKIRSYDISKYKGQLPIKSQPILQNGLLIGAIKKKRKPIWFYISVFLGVCGAIGFISLPVIDIYGEHHGLPYIDISCIVLDLSIPCVLICVFTAWPYWLTRGLTHFGVEDGKLIKYKVVNPDAGLANISDAAAAGFALETIQAVKKGSVPSGMSVHATPIDLVLKYKETDKYIKIKFVEFEYESDGSISNIGCKHRATIYKDYQDMDKVLEIIKNFMINNE